MRWRSRTPPSTPTLGKLLESAALVEARRLRVHRESKRTRECRAPKFLSDRKVVRPRNRFFVIAARVPKHVRVNHRVGRTRSIRLDKPLHRQEQVRSFVGRSKMYT